MGGLCAVSRALRGGPLSRAARSLFAALSLAFAAPAFAQFPGPVSSSPGVLKAVPVSGGFPASAWATATINAPTGAIVNGNVAGLATLQTARTAISLPTTYRMTVSTANVTRAAMVAVRGNVAGILASLVIQRLLSEGKVRWDAANQRWEKETQTEEGTGCWYSGNAITECHSSAELACKAHPQAGYYLARDGVYAKLSTNGVSATCMGKFSDQYGKYEIEIAGAAMKTGGETTTSTRWDPATEPEVELALQPKVQAAPGPILRDLATNAPNTVIPGVTPSLHTPVTSRTGTAEDGTPVSVIVTNQPDGTITGQESPSPIPDSNNGEVPGDTNKPREEPLTPAVDPDMPPIPKLYERKYPDGLVGVWNAKQAAWKDTQFYQAIAALTPNLGDGGCPKWTLPLNFGKGFDYGERDFSIPCYIWDALRILLLVYALFVARGLIFGG